MASYTLGNVNNTGAWVWASCPSGEHVLGGGMTNNSTNPQEVQMFQSYPTSNTQSGGFTGDPGNSGLQNKNPAAGQSGWAVEVFNTDSGHNWNVTVYAICANTN